MIKKQITVITFSLSNNGAERVLSELSNEWSAEGHEVTIIQFEKEAYGGASFEISEQVKLITLDHKNEKNKLFRYLHYLKDIRQYLLRKPNTIVVCFSFTTQFIVTLASLFLKNLIIFSERNDPNSCPYTRLDRKIRTLCFFRANRCVFQTDDAMSYFPKQIQKRGTVIMNPINPNLPDQVVSTRRKTIVTAARLRPQKNLSLLIRAFAKLHRDFPEFSLEIYGIGEEETMLKDLASKEGISQSVYFMGYEKNVNQKMLDAAMYVCSSNYEGISNSLLEAVGMGVPTISTDCPIGGASQVIKNRENGILVPVGDVEAMYHAMCQLIEDQDLAIYISRNGYKIREDYRVDKIAKKWLCLFDDGGNQN